MSVSLTGARARTRFEGQANAARLLVVEARRLRHKHGNLIVEFDDRSAVWHGVEDALRDMEAWPGDKSRVAAYIESNVLRQSLEGAMTNGGPTSQPHTDHAANIIEDGLRSMAYDEQARTTDRAFAKARRNRRHVQRGEPEEEAENAQEVVLLQQHSRDLAVAVGEQTFDAQAATLRLTLEGHRPDADVWALDFGILDPECGCPDDERREYHRRSIYDGHFDFGICKGCPLLQDGCRYQKKALRQPGLIVSYNGDESMGRSVSVLLGPVPEPAHVADTERIDDMKAIASKEFGIDAPQLIDDIVASRRVKAADARRYAQLAHVLRRQCAKLVSELRMACATTEQMKDKTKQQEDDLETLVGRFSSAQQRRRDLCGLRTVFEVGEWEARGGRRPRTPNLSRPVVTPPLIGHYVAFPDNIAEWSSVLAPLGARKVRWTSIEALLREPEPVLRKDVMVEVVETASAIIEDGGRLTQQRIADRLGIGKSAVSERLRSNGWEWPWVKELAERLATGSTG